VSESTAPFGDLLRQSRIGASLSQEELAQRSGLSVRGISDLERGARSAPRLETVRMLADALGVGQETRAALLAAARPASSLRGATSDEGTTLLSVPIPLTRLIGREAEVEALRGTLLRADVRFVTLTGAGGTGKTRLATAVALGMSHDFPDGVVFVDFSPLIDPALVIPTIATTLGVREVIGQGLVETLGQFLAAKRLLLLLDNCERVLAAAPELTALLAACPNLTVLATSRQPFHVRGEREFPLLPLPLPAVDRLPELGDLIQIPAIALFIERAEAGLPDFTLTAEQAASVAAICCRLDGLPLAIELAAARVKVLPPAELLARLERRLPLLVGGGRDLPDRQRTMRDAIAWSYDLLAPHEQTIFRRLAVFAGGFTLETAESVVAPGAELSVLDGIVALVEQSLVRQVLGSDTKPRFLMLETVREYGLERLASHGELDEARRKHAEHFLRLSDDLVRGLAILMDQASLTRVVAEHDNVRLALAWFDEHGEIDALLELSALLYGLWFGRGLYREGVQWVERALERSDREPSIALVRALDGAGTLAIFQGDYARATAFIEEGLALAREVGDPTLIGEAMTFSAFLAFRRQEFARAEALLDEARRTLGEAPFLILGGVVPFLTLGDIALAQRQFSRAATQYEEAIERFRTSGSEWGLRDMQAGLAATLYLTGDCAGAAVLYRESLQQSQALQFWPIVVSSLLGLAGIAADARQTDAGARLLGAAEGLAARLGTTLFTRDDPVYDRVLATLRPALGEERLAATREAGRVLTIEVAIAEAQAVAETVGASLIPAD
jgi:predicted ATPase/DNA-binding XRE family transcriptional regulator